MEIKPMSISVLDSISPVDGEVVSGLLEKERKDFNRKILLTKEHMFAIIREKGGEHELERRNVIFHIDVNSAFLSWEAVYRLHHLGGKEDLREKVSAVGGDMAMRHGIILAKSIPAKKFHIKTGETILEAKQKCPELILVPPNYGLYEKCSKAFMDILRRYSPTVEQYSIDEAFVDMTGTEGLWGDAVTAAYRMKDQIRDTLGFTVNIGISENKLLAKMASDFEKPNKVHTLFPEEIREKMWPLPIRELYMAGSSSVRTLEKLEVRTIGDLARMDPAIVELHLKSHGRKLWEFANGIDDSLVEAEPTELRGSAIRSLSPGTPGRKKNLPGA